LTRGTRVTAVIDLKMTWLIPVLGWDIHLWPLNR